MKPVAEVRQETAEVLGNAVAEVAKRAIRPELEPFKQSLDALVGKLEGHAEELEEQVRAERKALDAVNKRLEEVAAAGSDQVAAVAQTQVRVQELQDRLDALAGELASTRDAQATTVAALSSLREEVLGWMRASSEHAERLTSVLGRADALADALRGQADALRSELSGKFDTGVATLRTTTDTRLDALQEELRSVLGKLSSRHEDHGRELMKTGQATGRVFHLAVVNLVLVLIALTMGGVALWLATR